jgi:hypothetical protein
MLLTPMSMPVVPPLRIAVAVPAVPTPLEGVIVIVGTLVKPAPTLVIAIEATVVGASSAMAVACVPVPLVAEIVTVGVAVYPEPAAEFVIETRLPALRTAVADAPVPPPPLSDTMGVLV